MWRRRATILFLRCALYAAAMAFLLWKLYAFRKLIEVGQLSNIVAMRQDATMTSIMAFVALVAWVTTWKFRVAYGTAVAIIMSGLLNGAGLFLFTFFCLGTIPQLAWNTRPYFLGEEGLVFFFIIIPLAVTTALIIEIATIPFLPEPEIDLADASWNDRPTLKL
jgi:hypothetical protein